MHIWVCRQISTLRGCFSNASHRIRQQIPTLRESYYNAGRINQLIVISTALSTLFLPMYLFVSMPRIGVLFAWIFFGILVVDFFWRDRIPALKQWIAESEHGRNNGKDADGNEELPPPSPGRRICRIFGRIFSYRIFSWWQSLQLIDRLYVLAFVLGMVGVIFWRIDGNPTTRASSFFLLAYGVSGIGFGLWLWPWLRKIWLWPLGKLALTLVHGGILLLSIIPARLLVAEALGLPPQDFDVTVAFCVLLFYLPLWLIVFEFLVAIFALIHFMASILCSFMTYSLLNALVLLVAKLFPVGSRPRLFLEHEREKFVWRGFMHILGAMAIAAGIAIFWEWYSPATRSLKPVVRAVAYFADYQQVPLYPGVDVNKRARLHENGVVSYAEEHGWDIVISVEKLP